MSCLSARFPASMLRDAHAGTHAPAGLAFWFYKRRQRLAASKLEHDIGDSVPEKAIEPISKGEMGEEEAGSEASDVVAHV